MRQKIVSILISLLPLFKIAQTKIILRGHIKDVKNGEAIGAITYLTNEKRGTTINGYGYYPVMVKQTDSLGLLFHSRCIRKIM